MIVTPGSASGLSQASRKLLNEVQEELKNRETRVSRPLTGEAMQQFLDWCQVHEIHLESRSASGLLVFDAFLLGRVKRMLAQLNQQPLSQGETREKQEEQAVAGGDEFSSQAESPREHRLLVSLPGSLARLEPVCLNREERLFADLDWRSLDLKAFEQLVVVEGLDSFYQLESPEQQLPASLHQALLVYQGDPLYTRAVEQLKACWRDAGKPRVYLGDFDARGLHLALAEGYSHLLLPSLEFLQQQALTLHQPEQQLRYQKSLRARLQALKKGHPLIPYLQLLINQQKSLKQRGFSQQGLQLVALN